ISEGNTTSTPVCIANAVPDALGRSDIALPLRGSRVAEWIHPPQRQPCKTPAATRAAGLAISGSGSVTIPQRRERVFEMLLDPSLLARVIPGCRQLSTV